MVKLRLGIIGCGGMTGTHQKAFAQLEDAVEVTAACDVDLARAQALADALGARHAAADYRDILPHCDAVMLVLPHHLHYEIGLACLNAGKHVLMEKPLCNTEEQCLELIHCAQRRGLVLMTAYCMHFHPLVVKLKELLDAKAYGDVFQISIWTEQYTRYAEGHWALRADNLGGGQFFSHGCHYIDLLLWFLGDPVRGTHLGTHYGTPWMEKDGTSNVSIEFASGALGYHFGTWGAKGSRLNYSIHAHCTDGMIEADITHGKLNLLLFGKEPEALLEYDHGKHTNFEIRHFAQCVAHNRLSPITNGPDSLQGLRVIWRLYEAEQKGVMADLRGLGLGKAWDAPGMGKLP